MKSRVLWVGMCSVSFLVVVALGLSGCVPGQTKQWDDEEGGGFFAGLWDMVVGIFETIIALAMEILDAFLGGLLGDFGGTDDSWDDYDYDYGTGGGGTGGGGTGGGGSGYVTYTISCTGQTISIPTSLSSSCQQATAAFYEYTDCGTNAQATAAAEQYLSACGKSVPTFKSVETE